MCRIRAIVHLIYPVFIEVNLPNQESGRCIECDPVSTNLIEFWNGFDCGMFCFVFQFTHITINILLSQKHLCDLKPKRNNAQCYCNILSPWH